jgi:hypothetical protein
MFLCFFYVSFMYKEVNCKYIIIGNCYIAPVLFNEKRPIREEDPREDFWRFFLGLPQENETLYLSEYKPQKSKDQNKLYYYAPSIEPEIIDAYLRLKEKGIGYRQYSNLENIKDIEGEMVLT